MKTAKAGAIPVRVSRTGVSRAAAGVWGSLSGRSGKESSFSKAPARERLDGAAQGAKYVEARTI
jgi:hypothetical protein